METIYKYPLQTKDEQVIKMPEGAEILSLQIQGSEPMIWARVDPERTTTEDRVFVVVGTGHAYPDAFWYDLEFVGTYQLAGGMFVGHVFERVVDAVG